MKRIISILIILTLVLSGCGSASLQSNQIQHKGEILTYGSKDIDDVFFEDGIDLVINESNLVRCISITNTDVLTYNGISVGDKITKVESQYNHETSQGNTISVAICGNREIEPTSQNKPENTIWINYIYDEGKIEKIIIYDAVYGEKMK